MLDNLKYRKFQKIIQENEQKIKDMPKAELHVHLDGSLRIDTMIELAIQSHYIGTDYMASHVKPVGLPSHYPPALIRKLKFDQKYESLEDCLKVFTLTTALMQNKLSLNRIAFELVEDAYCENIQYMEIRFAPHLHTNRQQTNEDVLNEVLNGLSRATFQYNVETKVIICGIRNLSPDLSLEMAKLAVAFKDKGVVGFDLAGGENGFPPGLHKDAFQVARDGGLGITIHAGESAGPESIKEALDLGATRIGHGCRIIEDKKLMTRAIKENIALECCPTSNWQTGAVKDLSEHPLKKCFDAGIKVTINTDNRLVHNTTLTKELLKCGTEMNLGIDTITEMVENGFKAKFTV